MSNYPKRKPYRLTDFDYSTNGAYFITACTKDRECILSQVTVGTSIARPYEVKLTKTGKIVDKAIRDISKHYDGVFVDNYVIMPNHIHLLLRIDNYDSGRAMLVPTVSRVMQQMKSYVSKQIGYRIWQEKFHDHIVRDEYDYLTRYQYIEENPYRWAEDEYYKEKNRDD